MVDAADRHAGLRDQATLDIVAPESLAAPAGGIEAEYCRGGRAVSNRTIPGTEKDDCSLAISFWDMPTSRNWSTSFTLIFLAVSVPPVFDRLHGKPNLPTPRAALGRSGAEDDIGDAERQYS